MTVRIKNEGISNDITATLKNFSETEINLPGISNPERRFVLAQQIIDSIRRIEYLHVVSIRAKSASLHTPYSGSFAPFGGAVVLHKAGRLDDAFWLVYLATHFGKHKIDGWNLTEDFYGRFGQGGAWDWPTASRDPLAISLWLDSIYPTVTASGRSRRFGNHRKFETLKPGPKGTGQAVASYIRWIAEYGSHDDLIRQVHKTVGQNPKEVFSYLYKDLNKVSKLGRLGKFDLLCYLGSLSIAPIVPDKAYISESTGPKAGAKSLFGSQTNTNTLESACTRLADYLDVNPQVIEDALCNWQKSPDKYVYFRG
ncbi:hypothetical protein [Roseospira goensis]|nr:hypothetical protein [Roseospira goensis]